jgi:hypothetical protein
LHRNCLLKHIIKGKIAKGVAVKEKQEENLSSYCMTLRKPENFGN